MVEISKIGRFFPLDPEGHILNDCREENLHAPWLDALIEVKTAYLDLFPDHIDGIYVRGSLPRGLAIANISDLDTFAVLKEGSNPVAASVFQALRDRLKPRYPAISDFEFNLFRKKNLLEASDHYSYRFMVKVLSLCTHGNDLSAQIQPFKPSRKLAVAFHGNIENEILQSMKLLQSCEKTAIAEKHCLWIMKRILRTGFAILMEEERAYTRDLYPCYEVFSKHYPIRENWMRQVLDLAINPPSQGPKIAHFLERTAGWFVAEVHEKLYGVRTISRLFSDPLITSPYKYSDSSA